MAEVDQEVLEGKHSALKQLAERWSVGPDTFSRVVADGPVVILQSTGPFEECFSRSFRIPANVANRARQEFRISAPLPDIRPASQLGGVR
jgi:hypothetical protein